MKSQLVAIICMLSFTTIAINLGSGYNDVAPTRHRQDGRSQGIMACLDCLRRPRVDEASSAPFGHLHTHMPNTNGHRRRRRNRRPLFGRRYLTGGVLINQWTSRHFRRHSDADPDQSDYRHRASSAQTTCCSRAGQADPNSDQRRYVRGVEDSTSRNNGQEEFPSLSSPRVSTRRSSQQLQFSPERALPPRYMGPTHNHRYSPILTSQQLGTFPRMDSRQDEQSPRTVIQSLLGGGWQSRSRSTLSSQIRASPTAGFEFWPRYSGGNEYGSPETLRGFSVAGGSPVGLGGMGSTFSTIQPNSPSTLDQTTSRNAQNVDYSLGSSQPLSTDR